jgi:nucleotide-binding universal stress UspA family protein
MKRFKNILVLSNFKMGADETLKRGADLAAKNDANLTVLNVIDDRSYSLDMMDERHKILERLCSSFPINQKKLRVITKKGNVAGEVLSSIEDLGIDLVVSPAESGKRFNKLIGKNTTAQILKGTNCPIYVVRPNSAECFRTVLVAVNAGKDDAISYQTNKRLLELGNSLAEMEMAELKVLYVWDYDSETKLTLANELDEAWDPTCDPKEFISDENRQKLYESGHYEALAVLIKLINAVFGESINVTPLVKHGDVEDAIMECIEETSADILVSEGIPKNPLMDAVMGNKGLQILNNARCCVLVARPDGI